MGIIKLLKGIDNNIKKDLKDLQDFGIKVYKQEMEHEENMAKIQQGGQSKDKDIQLQKLKLLNSLLEMKKADIISEKEYQDKRKKIELIK